MYFVLEYILLTDVDDFVFDCVQIKMAEKPCTTWANNNVG